MTASVTTDYFLDQSIAVKQMKGAGHRSGLDAIMLAATLPAGSNGQIADLGAGTGVVGMAVAHRCPASQVDLFEIDPALVELSNQSLKLDHNSHLVDRVTAHCADIDKSNQPLLSVARKPGSYSAILCNPPYNDSAHQASPDESRALAHMAAPATADVWIKTAAQMAAHKACLALIVRPANLTDYSSAIQRSFGNVILKPLHAKPDEPATRLLIGSRKGGKAALRMLPPLVLHQSDGTYTDEAEEILRGRSAIDLFA